MMMKYQEMICLYEECCARSSYQGQGQVITPRIICALLGLFIFWWWRHNWFCNADDDVIIEFAIVTCAREKWYLTR